MFGHDVLTVAQAGRAGQGIDDPDVLAYAIFLGRAVLTFNRWDFIRLHLRVRPHAGIIVCTRDPDIQALAGRIHQAVVNYPRLDDQLLRINRPAIP
ncbi:MAG: DUF5615 family PIN-like protein [Gemmataceae bacterium]|nr:DUF5615 family PIN-like protein [Gemmataceae bacterium]